MNTNGSYQESRWPQSKYWFDFLIYWLEIKIVISKTDVSVFTVQPRILLFGLSTVDFYDSHAVRINHMSVYIIKSGQCSLGFIDDIIFLFLRDTWQKTHTEYYKHFILGLSLGNVPVLYCCHRTRFVLLLLLVVVTLKGGYGEMPQV